MDFLRRYPGYDPVIVAIVAVVAVGLYAGIKAITILVYVRGSATAESGVSLIRIILAAIDAIRSSIVIGVDIRFTETNIARVTFAVTVRIHLVRIIYIGTIVALIPNSVIIAIHICARFIRTQVAGITNPVTFRIKLVRICDHRTVIAVIPNAITVRICLVCVTGR
jgi:hypothetical protein